MDFVIAIKTEPNRVVKKNATNNITLLVSPVVKAADKTILHRDNAYLNKLEGTCFKCSKLSEIPPVEVCVVPDPDNPDPSSCLDQNPNNICGCFYCPDPPGPYSCFGGSFPTFITGGETNRYPTTASVPDVGSGYWVGLQANNFYSNPLNGGWVVAVECETSEVVGAFPVSTPNFGYGSGTILGYSVMLYPAGIAYGAGGGLLLRPYARTSYPILAQNTADGDELINTGFILTGPNQALGVPYQDGQTSYVPSSSYPYFCNTGPAGEGIDPLNPQVGIVTINKPNSCLQKYGSSSCPEFNSVPIQPSFSSGSSSYFLDVRKVQGIDLSNIPTDAVFSFANSSSDLGNYCSGVEDIEQFENFAYDAIFGVCSIIDPVWPDVPQKIYPDGCSECVNDTVSVPCQYVSNLTMGSFQLDRGGYNAASGSPSAYNAIGPGNPPRVDFTSDSGGFYIFTNTDFWEKFWDWDPNSHYIELARGIPDVDEEKTAAILPPIGTLLDDCACRDEEFETHGVGLKEYIKPVCGTCDSAPIFTIDNVEVVNVVNAGRACVPECSRCLRVPNVEFPTNFTRFGRNADYGKVTCFCKDSSDPPDTPPVFSSTVTQNIGPSIWWMNSIYGDVSELGYEGRSEQSPISPPGTLSDPCIYGVPTNSDYFGTDPLSNEESCFKIFEDLGSGEITFNNSNFEDCSGYNDFNNPCFKSKFLPIGLQDKLLIVKSNIQTNSKGLYNFNDNVGYFDGSEFISIKQYICGDSVNCPELKYLNGPMQGRPSLGKFAPCSIPGILTNQIDCDDGTTSEFKRISFISPSCPDGEDCSDPCACCASEGIGTIGQPGGGVGCAEGSGCPSCCEGAGCITGDSCS